MEDGRQFCEKYKCFVLQGFEIGFKKTLERGKYMKKRTVLQNRLAKN